MGIREFLIDWANPTPFVHSSTIGTFTTITDAHASDCSAIAENTEWLGNELRISIFCLAVRLTRLGCSVLRIVRNRAARAKRCGASETLVVGRGLPKVLRLTTTKYDDDMWVGLDFE